jgi:hypothetical protein
MPYDFIVTAKRAGTIDVEYTPGAARTNTAVSAEEQAELPKQKTLEEVALDLRAKQTSTKPATQGGEEVPFPDDESQK